MRTSWPSTSWIDTMRKAAQVSLRSLVPSFAPRLRALDRACRVPELYSEVLLSFPTATSSGLRPEQTACLLISLEKSSNPLT